MKPLQKPRDLSEDDFKREWTAFERLLPELLYKYQGWFVAICNGKVVDKDKNKSTLAKRVWRKTSKFVLIEEVAPNASREWHMSTPFKL